MDGSEVARVLIVVGGVLLALMGGLHAVLSVADSRKPTLFAPLDDEVRRGMEATSVRFSKRLNMWHAWVGFNISHGLGAFAFGTVFVLMGLFAFPFLAGFKVLMVFGAAVALAYLLISLSHWIPGVSIGSGLGFACLAVACVLV
jgi:hypothetical protein